MLTLITRGHGLVRQVFLWPFPLLSPFSVDEALEEIFRQLSCVLSYYCATRYSCVTGNYRFPFRSPCVTFV